MTYDFGNSKGMYVNYSVGFAPPNITDLYSSVQVPTLKPSSYNNYEIGGWLAFADAKGYAEASLYQLDGSNDHIAIVWNENFEIKKSSSSRIAIEIRNADGQNPVKQFITSENGMATFPVIKTIDKNAAFVAYTESVKDRD